MQKKQAIWNAAIVKRAILDSLIKLNPRSMMKNPVMFVVEVGSVLTTLQLIRGLVAPIPAVTNTKFELQITLWLWFTVLFANFAEAMAEGRGKAQADNLRKSRTETTAKRSLALRSCGKTTLCLWSRASSFLVMAKSLKAWRRLMSRLSPENLRP